MDAPLLALVSVLFASAVFADANNTAEALKAMELKLSAKVAEGGHKLFGSITTIDLASAFDKEGQSIEKKYISIVGGSVKALGKYTATVRLHREVLVDVSFEVIAE